MSKRKNKKQQAARRAEAKAPQSVEEKTARIAHKILTQTIGPANLALEEVVDVLTMILKGIVISNTSADADASDEDHLDMMEERSDMVEWIGDRVFHALNELDPFADLDDPDHVHDAHAWFVDPQGLITEPVGILWSGEHAEGSVRVVLGSALAALRAEISEANVLVTEGLAGLAIVAPEWDGEETVTCDNPACGLVHNAHLRVAENLFQDAKHMHRAVQHAPSN